MCGNVGEHVKRTILNVSAPGRYFRSSFLEEPEEEFLSSDLLRKTSQEKMRGLSRLRCGLPWSSEWSHLETRKLSIFASISVSYWPWLLLGERQHTSPLLWLPATCEVF